MPLLWSRNLPPITACGWSPDGNWLALKATRQVGVEILGMPSGAVICDFETGSAVTVLAFPARWHQTRRRPARGSASGIARRGPCWVSPYPTPVRSVP